MSSERPENQADVSDAAASAQAEASKAADEPSSATGGGFSEASHGADREANVSAANLASQASEQLQDFLAEQIGFGAELTREAAEAGRAFADQLDEKSPHMADMLRKAAFQADKFAQDLNAKTPTQLLDAASDFARQRPAAFLCAAAAVGFLAARFLRSAPAPAEPSPPTRGDAARERDDSEGLAP
jgi:ABC-type transporter Mla subunit MlaD